MPRQPVQDPVSRFVDAAAFTRTVDFAGVFKAGDGASESVQQTSPLSIQIRYSEINAHPPTGVVFGTRAEFRELELFFVRSRGGFCSIQSVSSTPGHERIYCSGVLLHTVSGPGGPKDERDIIKCVIGYFRLREIRTEYDFRPVDGPNDDAGARHREATCILGGPTLVWASHATRIYSCRGSVKTVTPRAHFRLAGVSDIGLAARPYFIRASKYDLARSLDPHIGAAAVAESFSTAQVSAEAEAFALHIEDRVRSRSDEEFSARSEDVAERLCLLASLLSKTPIRWFEKTIVSGDRLVRIVRDVEVPGDRGVWWEDIIVLPEDLRAFFSRAFGEYGKLRDAGTDLKIPILLYVAAQKAVSIGDTIILLFRALEALVALLDAQAGGMGLLDAREMKAVRAHLQQFLRQMGKPEEHIDQIIKRASNLSDPPLAYRLKRHLSVLKIDLADIGGEDGVGKMMQVRNRLVHAGKEPPIRQMDEERARLETILDRMFLRLLGWRGRDNTPTYVNRIICQ